jgi:hypothetical protein
MSFKDAKKKNPASENRFQTTVTPEPEVKINSPVKVTVLGESKSDEKVNPVESKRDKTSVKKIPKIAKVIKALVNIRKSPSLEGEILTTAAQNAEFKVNEELCTNDFVSVMVDRAIGYIKADLVSVIDNPAYISHTVKQI